MPDDLASRAGGRATRQPRRRVPRALFESALIVFSVLLAFALNEWGQSRAQAARAGRALDGIRRELVANRAATEASRRNHLRTVASLARLDSLRLAVPESVYYRGMFNPAPQMASAWESARASGMLTQLPYDLVLALSEAYTHQARYHEMSTRLAEALLADQMRRGAVAVFRDGAPNFRLLADEWARREAHLMAECDSVVARIDRAHRGAAPR